MNENLPTPIPKGRLKVFACGGAAINIVAKVGSIQIDPALLADIEVAMVDTSRSNLQNHSKAGECYLVEGLDGSGKVRAENSTAIGERIKEILQRHQPGDLNVVLHSGAGGSGSVIGPLLVSELLARNIAVVVLMVGSTSSTKEAENTLKTLKSYEAIVQKRQLPVVLGYLQNSATLARGEVDKQMVSTITYLSILYSRRNRELDTKDLYNWLRYSAVTTFEPRLSTLSVFWHPQGDPQLKTDMSRVGNVISVATLAGEDLATDLPVTPEYQAVGILPNIKSSGEFFVGKLVNYVISVGPVSQYAKDLTEFLAAQAQLAESRPPVTSILGRNDSAGDDGLVL